MAKLMGKAVEQGYRPKRAIVFASFTGEESGYLALLTTLSIRCTVTKNTLESICYLSHLIASYMFKIPIGKRFNPTSVLLLILFLAACNKHNSVSKTIAETGNNQTFQNPVFNHDFPDPNLVQSADGYFYAYSTNVNWQKDSLGGPYTIPILRSKNLVSWQVVGDALAKKPGWKKEGGIWAPDAAFFNNTYFLYYSYSTWGDPDPGIGVATSTKPEGPFTDHGKLFFSKEIGVGNSIDPVFFEDEGKPYLVWGSFHGIYAIELSADGLHLQGTKFQIGGNSYEGSLIYKKDGYYYYFGSTGTCCEGATSTYQVNVARSTSFKGPYIDKEGKALLQNGGTMILHRNAGAEGYVGTGHNGDIVEDKAGQTWMVYHAYDKKKPKTGRVMLLDEITWVDGWPVIGNAEPALQSQATPVFP